MDILGENGELGEILTLFLAKKYLSFPPALYPMHNFFRQEYRY